MEKKYEFIYLDRDWMRRNGYGCSDQDFTRAFNKLGQQGYHIVGAHPNTYTYVFEREIPSN